MKIKINSDNQGDKHILPGMYSADTPVHITTDIGTDHFVSEYDTYRHNQMTSVLRNGLGFFSYKIQEPANLPSPTAILTGNLPTRFDIKALKGTVISGENIKKIDIHNPAPQNKDWWSPDILRRGVIDVHIVARTPVTFKGYAEDEIQCVPLAITGSSDTVQKNAGERVAANNNTIVCIDRKTATPIFFSGNSKNNFSVQPSEGSKTPIKLGKKFDIPAGINEMRNVMDFVEENLEAVIKGLNPVTLPTGGSVVDFTAGAMTPPPASKHTPPVNVR